MIVMIAGLWLIRQSLRGRMLFFRLLGMGFGRGGGIVWGIGIGRVVMNGKGKEVWLSWESLSYG